MKLVSPQCIAYVKNIEGFSATPYDDSTGVMTIGYGFTGEEIVGITYMSEAEASIKLEALINGASYAAQIKGNLDSKGVTLTQNEFDALTSLAYNIGTAGLFSSTLYRNVVAGIRDRAVITENFQRWCKDGAGNTMPGLFRRRTEEADMFFETGNRLEGNDMKLVVTYKGDADVFAAVILSQFYHCQLMLEADYINSGEKADKVIPVGGTPGSDRYSTFKDAASKL